ncbi:MAG: hypothetical protein HYW52_09925 [Gemmatimonadetes bacterium]|nr:hypothetical protein [Gemmatimonadota bacterium]MBI2615974.1 hypothetical protein [Gemmatimonadota bacterium]
MFIGHLALGFAAKRAAPKVSLGTLFVAVQLVDMIWPIFLLLGLEHVRIDPGNTALTPLDFYDYPWTHSLLAAVLWGLLFAAVWYAKKRESKTAVLLAGLVVSHWMLDWVTHRPDLPLYPGGALKVGLGLWNSVAGTVVVEGALFAAGVTIYLKTTRALDKVGQYALWALIGFLALAYVLNLASPPPPSVEAIAWAGQAGWLLLLWAVWADRHRGPAGTAA